MIIKNLLALKKAIFTLAVCYTIALAVVSLISLQGLPSTGISNFDKIAHFGAYAVLFSVWYLAFQPLNIKKFSYLLLACVLYGIILEAFQGKFTTERVSDFLDIVANTVGVLSAAYVMPKVIKSYVKK